MGTRDGRNSATRRAYKAKLFGGRDTAKCCFCRAVLVWHTATLEHVVPLSRGGGKGLSNLRLSCAPCNHERGSEDFAAFQQRKRAGASC